MQPVERIDTQHMNLNLKFAGISGWQRTLTLVVLAGITVASGRAQAVDQDAVRDLMAHGNRAMQSADFGAAAAVFAEITRQVPTFAEGYFNLGLALEQKGELDKADVALRRASELKPGLRGANLFRGIVAYRQNHFKVAETLLEKETRLSPRDPKAFMWLGVCRLAENDPHGAIEPLDKAYALDPKDVDILYHRGHAYLEVANASYAAMYKQDRDSARVHQVLAEAYAKGFRTPEAINEYQLAVKIAPHQPGLQEDLADQYWIAGQLDKAEEGYRAELRNDPFAASAMYKLGSLLVLHENPDEGVRILQATLRADPSLIDAHYYLGTGFAALDKNDEAVREFQQAIAADPGADRAMSSYYKLAQVCKKLHRSGEAKTALADFQRMRADVKARQDSRAAQIVRNRTELPVQDPEHTAAVE